MLNKEQKTVISLILGMLTVILFVCLYGFTIGGEFLSFKYILYCLITSFTITIPAFLFIFKRENFKIVLKKEIHFIFLIITFFLQILLYQPLNLLSSSAQAEEYEVNITDLSRGTVYFVDKDGKERKKYVEFRFVFDEQLTPQPGGRMIVKETTGGFNCKHFEIVSVTYVPRYE